VAIGLLLAGSATSASAHPQLPARVVMEEPAPPSLPVTAPAPLPATSMPGPAAAPPASVPLWPALALALALGAALATPRRVRVTALILILVVLAVETGLHSVHHLADQQATSYCAVAVASANVHGTAQPTAVDGLGILMPLGAVVAVEVDRPGARPLRPDEGRAPPA
jgi:hypothetical protein